MSYNGIGLQTARGSGTSGYVQRNVTSGKDGQGNGNDKLGHHQSRKLEKQLADQQQRREKSVVEKQLAKTPILDHDAKRKIEVKCMELRDRLEDESEDEEVIEEQVKKLRARLNMEEGAEVKTGDSKAEDKTTDSKAQDLAEGQTKNAKDDTPQSDRKRLKSDTSLSKPYNYVPRYSGSRTE